MLCKQKSEHQSKGGSQLRRRFKLFSKMTRSGPVSPYEKMDCDVQKKKKARVSEAEDNMDKENNNMNKEVKDKKAKKRSWKRFRQVALTTCRYIGMGVAHMSPATVYTPDYYIDPKCWNKSFSPSYKCNPQHSSPHWTNNMMWTAGW